MVWTQWGWIAQQGPFYILGFIPALACAVAAFTVFTARTRLNKQPEHGFGEALAWIATLLLAVIPVTEFLAPLLELAAPRLGALSVTILGAILWILSLTLGEYAPPPGSFAREMLDSLTEGVALVNRFDGEFPDKYFNEIMEYIDMKPEEFNELCNKYRSPHLWGKDEKGDWRLRHTVVGKGLDD